MAIVNQLLLCANRKIKFTKKQPSSSCFICLKKKFEIYLLGFIKSTFLYLSLMIAKFLSASMRVLKLPTHTL